MVFFPNKLTIFFQNLFWRNSAFSPVLVGGIASASEKPVFPTLRIDTPGSLAGGLEGQ